MGRGHLPPDLHVEGNAGRIAAPCTPATAPATVAGRTDVAKVARARDCYDAAFKQPVRVQPALKFTPIRPSPGPDGKFLDEGDVAFRNSPEHRRAVQVQTAVGDQSACFRQAASTNSRTLSGPCFRSSRAPTRTRALHGRHTSRMRPEENEALDGPLAT